MSFVLPQGARAFFKLAEAPRDSKTKFIMFDQYYCCLMAGLDARKLGAPEDSESEEFVKGYPDDYKHQADLIAGLLIDAELDRKGIQSEDRASIEREIVTLLDPTSPTRLSAEGNALLNRYAAEGFKLIHDQMLAPANLEDFLVAYHTYWHPPSTNQSEAP